MTAVRVLLSRVLDVLLSGRRERRLEEEISNHLDLLTDQYIAEIDKATKQKEAELMEV